MKKSFSQYMKKYQLEDRNPYAVQINDKICVKDYCEERLPENIVDELFAHRIYAGYDAQETFLKTAEIKNRPCVIRANNRWHVMKFLVDPFDHITIDELNQWQNHKLTQCEWAYRQIKPGFTVEKLLPIKHNLLKFFVFNGQVEFIWQQTYTVEHKKVGKLLSATMHDYNWKKLDVQWNTSPMPKCKFPKRLNEMILICEALSNYEIKKPWPFCRVDLYYNDDEIRLSEIMNYHAGGTNGFGDFDYVLGSYL